MGADYPWGCGLSRPLQCCPRILVSKTDRAGGGGWRRYAGLRFCAVQSRRRYIHYLRDLICAVRRRRRGRAVGRAYRADPIHRRHGILAPASGVGVLVYSVGYAVVLGAGNTYAARQAFAAERLAKMAERERIARDLHDVLGHTLSVIILKAELAGKLLDRDLQRAKAEIADVEKISREALAEVRHTIRGYRSEGLQVEIERAKSTLETAGVAVEYHSARVGITPAQESVLALALREAVTNVVRHAQAKTCRLQLLQVNGVCRLEIQDDGRGGLHAEGDGLRGMRERIEALGGSLLQDAHAGTKLTITLPLAANAHSNEL